MDHKIDFLDIPCVRCMLQRNMISPKRCSPETCEKLTVWIEVCTDVCTDRSINVYTDRTEIPKSLRCPQCNSGNVVRHGFYRYKNVSRQKFQCNHCGRVFRKRSSSYLFKFKTPIEIIRYAFMLDNQNVYSTRDIPKKIMAKFNRKISHVTVGNWLCNEYLREKLKG